MADNSTKRAINVNREFIDKQRSAFAVSGGIIRELLNVSIKRPVLSLMFLFLFGLLSNSVYGLIISVIDKANCLSTICYPINRDITVSLIIFILLIIIVFVLVMQSRSLYKNVPLHQKKAIITLSSINKTEHGFSRIPAYAFIEAMLFGPTNAPRRNLIEKIFIISSEDTNVLKNAKQLKKFYEMSGERQVRVIAINLNKATGNVESIRKQIREVLEQALKEFNPSEIIADFTGGTKELSVSLYLESSEKFILPAYLDVAKRGNTGQVNT